MNEPIYICAANMIKFGSYPDAPVAALGSRTIAGLFNGCSVEREAIQAVFVGTWLGGNLIGQRALRGVGMSGVPTYNTENTCATGAAALSLACMSIQAGQYDTVLVVGVEKLSALGKGALPLNQDEPDVVQGLTMPTLYAMRAQRYMYETGATIDDLCAVVMKSRRNAALSPYTTMKDPVTPVQIAASRMVATPLTLFHCCPNVDGAASVIVSSKPLTGPENCIKVAASVVLGGIFKNGERDITWPDTAVRAAYKGYEMAGIEPGDVDVAEVHDAFSIAEILYYEGFGWSPRGQGYRDLRDGSFDIDGRVAVNAGGGMLSRGHPIGATGVAQAVEIYEQLLGRAGARQVQDAKVGFAQVQGGGISYLDVGATGVHIFTR